MFEKYIQKLFGVLMSNLSDDIFNAVEIFFLNLVFIYIDVKIFLYLNFNI